MFETKRHANSALFAVQFACLLAFLSIPAALCIKPAPPLWGALWAISIFAFTVFLALVRPKGAFQWGLLGVGSFAFVLANLTLAASFITQGHALNTAFFSHLDTSTLKIAWAVDRTNLVAGGAYILAATPVCLWLSYLLGRARPTWPARRFITTAMLLIAVALSYPLTSFIAHFQSTRVTSERMLAEIQTLRTNTAEVTSTEPAEKNLILIYLEGLERNYFDDAIFPDLTPRMDAFRENATWFADVHQFPGTNWTVAGMVASQCGVPLLTEGNGNRVLTEIDNPFRSIPCLAELLRDDGFQTVYLGGAPLNFAGKGRFLSDNGYDVTLGIDELPTSIRQTWGMYDQVLFERGTELFDALVESEQHFLLTMLTLDTHNPVGYPSPDCTDYGDGTEEMLNAVFCTDQLIGAFLDHVAASSVANETVIVLMSDHLLISGSTIEPLGTTDRRITFMMLDPDRPGSTFEGASTHFDIAPTVLDALGKSDTEFFFGHSLLQHQQGRAFEQNLNEQDFMGFTVESLLEQPIASE